MERCVLCPRQCKAERNAQGGSGVCGMGETMRVARAAPHFGEEPCISGLYGAGNIFFSGCTLRCAFCQNYEISHRGFGKDVSPRELADIMKNLEDEGVHNIAFVTGTHFIPGILQALSIYRPRLSIVWNTSGYETVKTLKMLEGAVDVYLPDLKHVSPRLAKVCAGAENYPQAAQQAIAEMVRQTGPAVFDKEGIMQRGTLVRHLILPGCTGDAMRVLDFIKTDLPEGTLLSLMHQYTPQPHCAVKGLERPITEKEYARVLDYAIALGLDGFMQSRYSQGRSHTPDFDLTGV